MKTGHAPTYRMALTGAMNVSVDTSTSSSASTPATIRAVCNADVPLDVATAYCAPVALASARSKRSTYSPTDDTQFVSRHSLMYAHSLPRISGTQSGIGDATAGAGSANGASCARVLISCG